MALGNTNYGNDQGTGTLGADGFLGNVTGNTLGNQSGGTVAAVGMLAGDGSAGLTAHAGGTQAAALALTAVSNYVSVCATNADSVKLPAPTQAGQIVLVINAGAATLQVFGAGTDTINGVTSATGVAQTTGQTALYVAATTGTAAKWFRILSA